MFPQVLSKETSGERERPPTHTPKEGQAEEQMHQRSHHRKELKHKIYEMFQTVFVSFQGSKVKISTRSNK